MATTTASIDIAASPDRVWQLIGGFDSLPDWLPYIPTSELSEGGRLRRLENEEGEVIVERLETFDNDARTYSYSILRAPFPVTGYRSTLTVHETPREDTARVEWSGSFTPDGISDHDAVALFHGIYTQGLTALSETLSASAGSARRQGDSGRRSVAAAL
ncbi:SRPBCC family protein [Streptomyces sp. NPDC002688]|uniref:SRPBCC family protein n=1 Tax=Streptomyces sp. NPDC002688 TaxID=3154423 RepID=UPI003333D850